MEKKMTVVGALLVLGMAAFVMFIKTSENSVGNAGRQDEKQNRTTSVNAYTSSKKDDNKEESLEGMEKLTQLKLYAELSKEKVDESSDKPPVSSVQVGEAVGNIEKELLEGKRDEKWEQEVAQKAEEALARANVKGVGVHGARCSVSVCSVDFTCDSLEVFEKLAQANLEGPWKKSEAFATSSNIEGQMGMKLYFSKEGVGLPVNENLVLPPIR